MMVQEYAYLPHGKVMPLGWEIADTLEDTHHGHYAVLIKRSEMTKWPHAEGKEISQ